MEKEISNLKEVSSININLDSIMVTYSDDSSIKIHLEDYNEIAMRKEIKQNFEMLKTKVSEKS